MDESQLTSMKTRIDHLQRQLARVIQDLEKLNSLKDQYNRLKKEFDIDQDSYKLYLGRLEESRISAAMDDEKISNVRAIETARPPLRPLGPSSLIVVLAATIAGLLGGALAALVVEFLQQRIERPEEVETLLGVPVLSSIPELTPRTT
jgi:tyrosine-protein kinase Etk/Wzc